mmetsp:Transcript_14175/g.21280  ORF Transcript_14175/g.21280 Transcript_14175/m.21280 type:complete len:310 (-) Transcript_14175:186-1115(-)
MKYLLLSLFQFLVCCQEARSFSLIPKNNAAKKSGLDRRDSIKTIITTLGLPAVTAILNPLPTNAIDLNLLDLQAKKFRKAPAFAIVNGETGVPFMILRNTGLATAYFFTNYDAAQIVLEDAQKDAKEKDLDTVKFWDDAKISAVSLEFALKLSKGRPRASAQNNAKYETVYDIIPSIKALDDAGRIEKSGIFNEQGRVPIFYMSEFEVAPEVEGGEKRIPVFFEKSQLISEWEKKYPGSTVPAVKVVDLVDTFSGMVGTGTSGGTDDRVVKNLYVVASPDSKKKAIECEKARGDIPAYKTGEMIAVGGK